MLVVSRGAISAATVLNVQSFVAIDESEEGAEQDYDNEVIPLHVYPQAFALPVGNGMRQLQVTSDNGQDVTSTNLGTLYFVSNPQVVTVSPEGLVTAGQAGDAEITVISEGKEFVIAVRVETPHTGPAILGARGRRHSEP